MESDLSHCFWTCLSQRASGESKEKKLEMRTRGRKLRPYMMTAARGRRKSTRWNVTRDQRWQVQSGQSRKGFKSKKQESELDMKDNTEPVEWTVTRRGMIKAICWVDNVSSWNLNSNERFNRGQRKTQKHYNNSKATVNPTPVVKSKTSILAVETKTRCRFL